MTNAYLPPGFDEDEYFGKQDEMLDCPTCLGTGFQQETMVQLDGQLLIDRFPCAECGGAGWIEADEGEADDGLPF